MRDKKGKKEKKSKKIYRTSQNIRLVTAVRVLSLAGSHSPTHLPGMPSNTGPVTQPYHLASMAAWLSSTGISQHSLLPHIPSIQLSAVNSSPCPRIAPHSLNSSSQPLHHLGYACCGKGCLILIPFRLPQMSCFALSHKCFSSDSGSCPNVGIGPCFNSPTPRGQVQFY